MTTLEITLSQPLREFIDAKVSEGAYATPSAFIESLVLQARKQATRAEFEALVLEGLESGPSIEVTPAYWQQKRQALTA